MSPTRESLDQYSKFQDFTSFYFLFFLVLRLFPSRRIQFDVFLFPRIVLLWPLLLSSPSFSSSLSSPLSWGLSYHVQGSREVKVRDHSTSRADDKIRCAPEGLSISDQSPSSPSARQPVTPPTDRRTRGPLLMYIALGRGVCFYTKYFVPMYRASLHHLGNPSRRIRMHSWGPHGPWMTVPAWLSRIKGPIHITP